MNDLFLTEPSREYEKSFRNYALAYREIKDNHYFDKYRKALENFDEFLSELYNFHKGVDIPPGRVPFSTFWLICDGEVVGVVRIRHTEAEDAGHIGYDISPFHRNKGYGTEILRLALVKALELGIENAILTCRTDNVASKRVIEKSNGIFMGAFFAKEKNENMYKFSIRTADRQI